MGDVEEVGSSGGGDGCGGDDEEDVRRGESGTWCQVMGGTSSTKNTNANANANANTTAPLSTAT